MPSVNKAILIGHLGRDPEIRMTQGGKRVANFSLATTERRGDEERTEWHTIVAWEKTAEVCEKYLTKGSCIYVEGRIQTRQYDDKDGKRVYKTEIVCDRMQMLDGKKRDGGRPGPADKDNDLPF